MAQGGNVRYRLKTPHRESTTHVIFEPEDFIARLAALVPRPRAHLTRYHGVFAPASRDRARILLKTRAALTHGISPANAKIQGPAGSGLAWIAALDLPSSP